MVASFMRAASRCRKSMHAIFYTDQIFCYAIARTDRNNLIIHKKEYTLTPALTPSLLYNPTQISNILIDFITQHNMHNSYLYLILAPPLAHEQLCVHPKNHASLQELIKPDPQRTYCHRYVGPLDERALFYVSNITKTLLLQLQLICKQLPCYVQAIQPFLSVEHALYNYTHPHNSARAKLAQMINVHTLHIEELSESPAVEALVKNIDITQDKNLIYALGSFVGACP